MRGPSLWSRSVRPPPQLVLLDVDFTLIRPARVFDAPGYAELGARFGERLDPGLYEQARLDALHVFNVETLEHRSAQHRRFAIEIVRRMGASPDAAEQIGDGGRAGVERSAQLRAVPRRPAAARLSCRRAPARSASSRTPIASSRRSPRSSESASTSRSPRAHTAAASPARRSSPRRWRSEARRPEAAVMVGDSVSDDIAGATSSGLRAVLVDRHGRYPDHPGERIRGLDELPSLLGLGVTATASARRRMTPRRRARGRGARPRRRAARGGRADPGRGACGGANWSAPATPVPS